MPIRFLMYFPEKKGIIVNLPEIRGTADAATLSLSLSLALVSAVELLQDQVQDAVET